MNTALAGGPTGRTRRSRFTGVVGANHHSNLCRYN